ncbi:MAG: hypothetical protein WD988_02070 [Candidatus Curtissbacteria bacterium]
MKIQVILFDLASLVKVVSIYMQPDSVSAKKRVEKEVLDAIINGLNSGKLPLEEAQLAARETLATLEKIDKHEETIEEFYRNLAEKYPPFQILYTKVKDELTRSREVSAYRQALSAIDEGQIDQAHQIAKGALEATANETANIN